jgi:hypothetical protein
MADAIFARLPGLRNLYAAGKGVVPVYECLLAMGVR